MKTVSCALASANFAAAIEGDEFVHPFVKFALVVVRFVHVLIFGQRHLRIVPLYTITAFCQENDVRLDYGVGAGIRPGSVPRRRGELFSAANDHHDQKLTSL